MSNRRNFIKATLVAAALSSIGAAAHAADTIKVGILHSLSGTMAISETGLVGIDQRPVVVVDGVAAQLGGGGRGGVGVGRRNGAAQAGLAKAGGEQVVAAAVVGLGGVGVGPDVFGHDVVGLEGAAGRFGVDEGQQAVGFVAVGVGGAGGEAGAAQAGGALAEFGFEGVEELGVGAGDGCGADRPEAAGGEGGLQFGGAAGAEGEEGDAVGGVVDVGRFAEVVGGDEGVPHALAAGDLQHQREFEAGAVEDIVAAGVGGDAAGGALGVLDADGRVGDGQPLGGNAAQVGAGARAATAATSAGGQGQGAADGKGEGLQAKPVFHMSPPFIGSGWLSG